MAIANIDHMGTGVITKTPVYGNKKKDDSVRNVYTSASGADHGGHGGTFTETNPLVKAVQDAGTIARSIAEKPVVPKTVSTTSTGSGGGSGYGGTYVDPNQAKMDELWNLFQKQNEEARQNRLNAIMAQLQATKDAYGLQKRQIGDEYDKLVDQNEVRKYRAMRAMRENQANRGIDTAGTGRQEGLLLDTNYNNKTIDIKKTKQQAIDEIANLMIQAEAEAENNKAQVNDTYDNALLQWRLANLT